MMCFFEPIKFISIGFRFSIFVNRQLSERTAYFDIFDN